MKIVSLLTLFMAIYPGREDEMKINVYAVDEGGARTIQATVKNISNSKFAKMGKDSMYILPAMSGDTIEVSMKGHSAIMFPAPKANEPFTVWISPVKN